MISLSEISTDILRNYHQLSPAQISRIRGGRHIVGNIDDRATALAGFGELLSLAVEMEKKGTKFIALKGPVLAFRLYGDTTARCYTDLDLLTDSASASQTVELLIEAGYSAVGPYWPQDSRLQKMLMEHDNQLTFAHPEKTMTVELHWRLFADSATDREREEEIVCHNTETIEVAGHPFAVLSDEMELLFLIIHGGKHYWRRLKWLMDVEALLVKKDIRVDVFARLTKEMRAERMVQLFIDVYLECFPGQEEVVRRLGDFCTRDTQWKPYVRPLVKYSLERMAETTDKSHDTLRGIFTVRLFELRSFPGIRYKARVLRNYMFVKEYLGKEGVFGRVPLFYLYCLARMAVTRLRRRRHDTSGRRYVIFS